MTILLIRHGSAGDPFRWSGDDADRPLDTAGTNQATQLADKVDALLAGRPLSEVRSSRAIRCLQTVGPAAARHALLPESDPSLFEGSSSAMTDLVRTRAGVDDAARRVVVLCSHADVIPDVIRDAQSFAEDALEWMLRDGVASRIQVTVERDGTYTMRLTAVIDAPDGGRYQNTWRNITFL